MTASRSPTLTAAADIALDALADALLPRLLPRIRAALSADVDERTKLMTPRDTPSPRATMEACRRGLIAGARKLHRKWTFTAAAWRAYVEASSAPPQPLPEIALDEEARATVILRRELGFVKKAQSRP